MSDYDTRTKEVLDIMLDVDSDGEPPEDVSPKKFDPRSKSARDIGNFSSPPCKVPPGSRSQGQLSYFASILDDASISAQTLTESMNATPGASYNKAPGSSPHPTDTIGSFKPGKVISPTNNTNNANGKEKTKTDKDREKEKEKEEMIKFVVANKPCDHNDWDDVRTRNGTKVLRCRTCQTQFKLASKTVPRCIPFLQEGYCKLNSECLQLHVHKKKKPLPERLDQFGRKVLKGVPDRTWKKAMGRGGTAKENESIEGLLEQLRQNTLQRVEMITRLQELVTSRPQEECLVTICSECSMLTDSTPFCSQTGAPHAPSPAQIMTTLEEHIRTS
eukprot:TRINITY_DN11021_c0_g2_i1.p1 TRINITY_DN11021_c0_g2~~TRINITY_DN11021_c0_g2_i1.p1  ORF type:complete len:342 (+),score=61.34 TRINITY_DN11021_c0_g2_i1:34-1026(+)